jgi:hypothetical protein
MIFLSRRIEFRLSKSWDLAKVVKYSDLVRITEFWEAFLVMQRSVCLKTTMPPFYILISHYPFLSHPIMPRHPTGIQTGFGFPHGRKTKYYNLKTCSSFPVRLEHAYFLVFVMPQYFTTNGNSGSGAEERIPFSSLTTAQTLHANHSLLRSTQ